VAQGVVTGSELSQLVRVRPVGVLLAHLLRPLLLLVPQRVLARLLALLVRLLPLALHAGGDGPHHEAADEHRHEGSDGRDQEALTERVRGLGGTCSDADDQHAGPPDTRCGRS
jgi:hypothetical protein